ncbi:hypothetical protein G9A89_016868 [Geosiphon pyriformis]|nr:hypothetical protein G9A89_016868 [Geosiphon pyriformis]
MELASTSTGSSGAGLTGLGTHSNTKKKHIDTVYSCGASYKKPKVPVTGGVIDFSASPLSLENIGVVSVKPVVSWRSDIDSIASSVSGLSDVKNMKNTVAEETSYAESDNLADNENMNKTTPRKTCTRTYVLGQLPKVPLFNDVSDDDLVLELLSLKFNESNQLPLLGSHVSEKRNFNLAKLFVLDIELSAVPGKTISDKVIFVKKIFYHVGGFGEASTLLKFSGIIRLSFTSESSLRKAKELAVNEKIMVNNNVRKVSCHSDWEIIVKEILVNLLKLAVGSVFSKFGKIVSIKMQLIGLWQKVLVEFELPEVASLVVSKWSVLMEKNSICVALAVNNKQSWMFRDQHSALLYTLPVGTTAYDLSGLLESYSEKTCFIGCNPSSYVCNRCAVVCFTNKTSKLVVIGSVPVFKSVSLWWAGLFLTCCAKCEQFGHVSDVCSIGGNSSTCASIVCPVFFGGKTWAQVAAGFFSHVVLSDFSGTGMSPGVKPVLLVSNSLGNYCLVEQLASLEWSLKLLADQVLNVLKKLSFMELVSLASGLHTSLMVVATPVATNVDSNMTIDDTAVSSFYPLSVVVDSVTDLSSSSSRVLTTKVSRLKSKIVTLEVSIEFVLERLNCLCSGLGSSTSLPLQ